MCLRAFCLLMVTLATSTTLGTEGLVDVELVPNPPLPYLGGETLTVDVWLHSHDVNAHDLRYVQLDIRPTPLSRRLFAGGAFTRAGGADVRRIAEFKNGEWVPLGADGSGPLQAVLAIAGFDDGSGPAIYVGGAFNIVYDCDGCPPVHAEHIAKWDGTSWQPVGAGLNEKVRTLTVYDDGTGAALYAGGDFVLYEGEWSPSVAKWDGAAWQPVGFGLNAPVRAFAIHDNGAIPFLAVGGEFWHAFFEPMKSIAKWNGLAFEPVGDELISKVDTLIVYDDGDGETLYAGGLFSESLNQPLSRIAKLQGDTWLPVGGGIDGYGVWSSTVFGTASGDVLVVGGLFDEAGGTQANNIAQWDGSAWSALGDGIDGWANALATFDDGCGPALFAGGNFYFAGGNPHPYMAKWDGGVWSSAGGDFDRDVLALSVVGGPDILRGQNFEFAPDFNAGAGYLEFPHLPVPSVVYIRTSPLPGIVTLDAFGSVYLGSLSVELPDDPGTYELDVMNADEDLPGTGAVVSFGFGTRASAH